MRVSFVGTAGLVPPGGVLSKTRCFPAILVDGDILLDCGEGALKNLKLLGVDLTGIRRILVSHVHPDHISGLANVLWGMWVEGKEDTLQIAGPEEIEQVATSLLEAMHVPVERFAFKTTFRKLRGGERFNDISTCKVIHPIPTIAYRIDRKGKSVCYSGDTAYSEDIVGLAQGCDLLIHEAVVTTRSKAHATPAEAGRIASQARVKRLALFHWPAEFEGREEALAALAKAEFDGEVIVGRDLRSIRL